MQNHRPLPDFVFKPWMLALVWALPMALLLLSNLSDWGLVQGEANEAQKTCALQWGLANLSILSVAVVWSLILFLRKKPVGYATAATAFVLQTAYLWFAVAHINVILPASVDRWILAEGPIMFAQLTGCVPALFYAALCFACRPIKHGKGTESALCAGGVIGIPLAIYFFGHMAVWAAKWTTNYDSFRIINEQFTLWLILLGVIVVTLAMGVCLLRLMILLFLFFKNNRFVPPWMLTFVVALVLPLGGMALNIKIPFPVDFQTPWVYALVVINTLALILPAHGKWALPVWFARCVCFSFTFYFFFVFLPFLPFSIPAILVAGAGFLILTPTVLFILHLLKLKEGYLACRANGAAYPRALLVILALAGFAVMPAWVVGQSYYYRHALRSALSYVCAPDTDKPMRFSASPQSVEHALRWLADYKSGKYMPIISPLRGKIMFDGLVFTDERMMEVYTAFTGKIDRQWLEGSPSEIWGNVWGRSDVRRTHKIRGNPFSNPNITAQASCKQIQEDGMVKSTYTLTIKNPTGTDGEFVDIWNLPEAVLISGIRLHIDGNPVPGRIFEKKSALWVYQMIRAHTQKDPAILYYKSDSSLHLSVFPVPAHGHRTLEIDLLHPICAGGKIHSGKSTTLPDSQGSNARQIAIASDSISTVLASEHFYKTLPCKPVTRAPVLHLIVDRGLDGCHAKAAVGIVDRLIQKTGPDFPAKVSFLNYQLTPLKNGETLPLSQWKAHLANLDEKTPGVPALEGGFLIENALMQQARLYACQHLKKDGRFMEYPIFMVVTKREILKGESPILRLLAACAPEAPAPLAIQPKTDLHIRFETRAVPVKLVSVGGQIWPVADSIGAHIPQLLAFETTGEAPAYYDPVEKTWKLVPHEKLHPVNGIWADGVLNYAKALKMERNPSLIDTELPALVGEAKKTEILVPFTANIVVENTAQWEAVVRAEKQALASSDTLSFTEAPEPSIFLMGGGAALLAWLATRRKRAA